MKCFMITTLNLIVDHMAISLPLNCEILRDSPEDLLAHFRKLKVYIWRFVLDNSCFLLSYHGRLEASPCGTLTCDNIPHVFKE